MCCTSCKAFKEDWLTRNSSLNMQQPLRLCYTENYHKPINISAQLDRFVRIFSLKNAIGSDWHLTDTAVIALWIYPIIYLLSCLAKNLHGYELGMP